MKTTQDTDFISLPSAVCPSSHLLSLAFSLPLSIPLNFMVLHNPIDSE